MKFSKYVFFHKINDDTIGVYHSLLIRVVFLTKTEKENVDYYLRTQILLNVETKEVVNYLYSNYYLVDSAADDLKVYQRCTNLISESSLLNTYVIVTENCNFNCKYCFISETVNSYSLGKNKVMTKEVVKATVSLLQREYEKQKSDGRITITFYGGEPLLNFDAIKCFINEVAEIKSKKYWPSDINYSIITNGSLLTKEHLLFFKKHNIGICISFDVDKKSHSHRIDKGDNETYDVVRKNIKLCVEEKMGFGLSVTVTENTIKNKESVLEEIIELKPLTIGFNMLIPNKNVFMSDSYYKAATSFIIYCFKRLRELGIYEDRIMRKVDAFVNNKLYPFDCCACGGNQLVVTPEGKIGICHGYLNNRKYFSANVFDNRFDFKNQPDFLYWKRRTPLLMAECQNCECVGICGGGCAYAAEYNHGSIYSLDERFCTHSKIVLDWLINDLYNNITDNHSNTN